MKARCKKELTFDGFTFKVDKEYDFEEKVVYLPAEESDVVLARGNRTRHLQYATHIDAVIHKTEKVPMTLFFYDRQFCIKKDWSAKGVGLFNFGGGMLLCFEDWFVESDFGSFVKNQRTLNLLPSAEEFWNTIMNNPLPRRFHNAAIDSLDLRYHLSCGQQERMKQDTDTKRFLCDHLNNKEPEIDTLRGIEDFLNSLPDCDEIEQYNGGIVFMDFGMMKLPLPVPEKDKKWAMRWLDTPSGELLPELVQVPIDEENNKWKEGYPKYQ
jgi:hypothetical protein